MDQELVPDQDMPSDDSFEQAVRDEGDVADTAATEIKTARSKESKKTGGENMEALVEGGRSVKVARLHEAPASFAKSKQSYCTAKMTEYAVTNYNETMKSVAASPVQSGTPGCTDRAACSGRNANSLFCSAGNPTQTVSFANKLQDE